VDIDRLKQERILYLQSQITTGYVIFFVFLGVIIGLEKFLVPTLTQSQPLGGIGGQTANLSDLAGQFRDIFRNLILIQGLFAGLAVGKMAEGALIAGLKHSLLMMFVGGIAFAIFG
jgi:flagellar protein FlaJ